MKLKSIFKLSLIGALALAGAGSALADTLTYAITGPTSMELHWTSKDRQPYAILEFAKNGSGVSCENSTDDCFIFGINAVIHPDWKVVYDETMTWKMYGIVKADGGKKTYTLGNAGSSIHKVKQS